ncbi:hypothetical protein ANOM_007207 [Aspergillus nomiae NRRL 13137]|uniref:SCP2 domain-containing protein n=1 Tax=Aspergillus nomiae NRRL (strain ATCC 15546 / NRRL 13137 / CBS 260.88 / M93) TaxID=1509407 RepID=A0A0L1IVN9_ASPN3|nr:uncharacterized protein ANOM_007207 [Aspergillus nomiae NRRL 13137]KNG83636.1 hypothetical protein ANOM_007207 [Aspergillus nomiae NRRL 13137]
MSEYRSATYFDNWSTNFHDASPEKRQELVRRFHTSYQITVKNGSEQSQILIDLKRGDGEITTEIYGHPDVYLQVHEFQFCDWAEGKSSSENLFRSAKLKVKGNIMAAMNINGLFQELNSLESD